MHKLLSCITLLIMVHAMTIFANKLTLKEPLVVILLGPPGSGKGTQATGISSSLGIPHLSTGDLFRANIGQGTELGKRAKTFMDAGQLVPDEIVLNMLFDRVKQNDFQKGYLLDGFPRTIPQAEALDLKLRGNAKVIALNLRVGDELILKRIEGRLSCTACGNIHNKYFSPSRKEGVCDKCGGSLVQRNDDKEDVVKERLRVYHLQTEPLVEYYSKKRVLATIDGEQAPEKVSENLLKRLQELVSAI